MFQCCVLDMRDTERKHCISDQICDQLYAESFVSESCRFLSHTRISCDAFAFYPGVCCSLDDETFPNYNTVRRSVKACKKALCGSSMEARVELCVSRAKFDVFDRRWCDAHYRPDDQYRAYNPAANGGYPAPTSHHSTCLADAHGVL